MKRSSLGKRWWAVLPEQILNSAVVGGITFFAVLSVGTLTSQSLKAAGVAFGLTFFTELRKLREPE